MFLEKGIHRGRKSRIVDKEEYDDLVRSHNFPWLENRDLYQGWLKCGDEDNVIDNQPIDLSLQFTFKCPPLQSVARFGHSAPSWYTNFGTDDDVPHFLEYMDRNPNSISLLVNSKVAFKKWIGTMKQNTQMSPMMKKKRPA